MIPFLLDTSAESEQPVGPARLGYGQATARLQLGFKALRAEQRGDQG